MTRYAARVVDCHLSICKALRALGYAVHDMSRAGEGLPDILISSSCHMWLAEIIGTEKLKKYKKTNGLNERQVRFHNEWRGKLILILKSLADVEAFHKTRLIYEPETHS